MSYILDALKKLEEKRRRETAPYLLSEERPARKNRTLHIPWRYVIVFSFLLNAGIFLLWLHPWRSEREVGAGMVNVAGKVPARGRLDMGGEGVAETQAFHGQKQDEITKTEGGPSKGYGAGYDGGAAAVSDRPPGLSSDKQDNDKRVISVNELPLSVRQRLPDLTISGHFYNSRPSFRIVTVGGRTLHEGDAAAPGLRVERITPDGAVFSFEGYSFQRGIF